MSTHPQSSRNPRNTRARLAGLLALGASLALSGCVVPGAVVYDDPYPVYPSSTYYPGTVYVEPAIIAPAPVWVDPFYVPSYRSYPVRPVPHVQPRPRPPNWANTPGPRPPYGYQPGYRPPAVQQPAPGYRPPDRRPPAVAPRPDGGQWRPGGPQQGNRPPAYRPPGATQHPGVRPVPQPLRAPRDTGENSGP